MTTTIGHLAIFGCYETIESEVKFFFFGNENLYTELVNTYFLPYSNSPRLGNVLLVPRKKKYTHFSLRCKTSVSVGCGNILFLLNFPFSLRGYDQK
jgi:hypothetical protein